MLRVLISKGWYKDRLSLSPLEEKQATMDLTQVCSRLSENDEIIGIQLDTTKRYGNAYCRFFIYVKC